MIPLTSPKLSMGVISLIPDELAAFGEVIQMISRQSILFATESLVYKYPTSACGQLALLKASLFRLDCAIVVSPTTVHNKLFYCYNKLPYSPLKVDVPFSICEGSC